MNKSIVKLTETQVGTAVLALLTELALAGKKNLSLAEYRVFASGRINYQDKETGKRMSFDAVWHGCEVGGEQIKVQDNSEEVRGMDEEAIANYKPPFEKGEYVVLELTFSGYAKGKGELHSGYIHRAGKSSVTKEKAKI